MTIRPIIFSPPMVLALLDGRKSQTRRLATSPLRRCEVGDLLYVREAVSTGGYFSDVVEVRYRASERRGHTEFVEQVPVAEATSKLPTFPKYRPSIHMPRWASRLTLRVTGVRTERLQDISDADARAEGIEPAALSGFWRDYTGHEPFKTPRQSYGSLWASLHGHDSWSANPDVLVLTFDAERVNIDRRGCECVE